MSDNDRKAAAVDVNIWVPGDWVWRDEQGQWRCCAVPAHDPHPSRLVVMPGRPSPAAALADARDGMVPMRPAALRERQIWFCDSCRALGVILYQPDEDVYGVATRVREAHDPTGRYCTGDPRIIVPENIDKDTVLLHPVGSDYEGEHEG